jgi:hypothetical protein
MFRGWTREPLFHFLLIGAALFAWFSLVNEEELPDSVVVSSSEVDSLAAQWEARRGRPPSPAEMESVVAQAVRTRVLAREAVALGLDVNDTVVERRLAQKLEFLFSDLVQVADPTDEELQQLLEAHRGDYTEPARVSFQHVYFSSDTNADARPAYIHDANRALELLRATPDLDISNMGDRTLLPTRYESATPRVVGGAFGDAFAESVFAITTTGWHGPIESAYGVHLVLLEERREAQIPELADVRSDVAADWLRARQVEANEAFYQSLHRSNTIVVGDET